MTATYDSIDAWDQPGLLWQDYPAATQQRKSMNRDEFALKLREKDVDEVFQLSVDMEQGLNTTSYVTTPNPTVASLAAKRAQITTLKPLLAAAESNLFMKRDQMDTYRAELGDLLTLSARNSQEAVSADRTKMTEMKIPLRATGAPATDNPPPITGLHVNDGDMAGEGDWSWPAQRPGRPLYILETGASATGPWTTAYTGLKSRFTSHTTPGAEVWARVTVDSNGFRSDPSQPVSYRPH